MRGARSAVLLIALLLVACSPPSRRGGDPFAVGGPRRGGVQTYQIQLEVMCVGCSVTWTVGSLNGTDRASSSNSRWSRRFSRTPLQREMVRIMASPGDSEPVRAARIYVNGDLVAEEVCECADFRLSPGSAIAQMRVETMIGG